MALHIAPIMRKEFIHILRDFRTLIIIFVMPVFQLLMFGYAINTEIQRIDLAYIDYADTPESRVLLRKFEGSRYFVTRPFSGSAPAIHRLFQSRDAHLVLIIPHDFARQLGTGRPTAVQILLDASDSNTGQIVNNYATAIVQEFNLERGLQQPYEITTTIQYNPTLKSTHFFVPGLIALILIMISALLTSIAIAREKETGTLEQILVSPIRPAEIIIGKVVPYIFLAFLDGLLILVVAHFWFDVPIRGSLLLMLGASLLYIFVALALGLLISTRVQTQQVAMMAALMATLLPSLMLSGFIFPLSSLPEILQYISKIVPATYFLKVIRGVMLKGNGLAEIGHLLAVLAVFGVILTAISVKRFKMTL